MLVDFLQSATNPLNVSQQFLATLGTEISTIGYQQIPKDTAMLIVSNHRSFMDVAVLMAALDLPIHFACHRYMGQIPIFGELVNQWGFLPLDEPKQRYHTFFDRASLILQNREAIGIFPEGTKPMVEPTFPNSVGEFHRGFAHLALRSPVENLIVLPVAIAAQHELNTNLFPVRWLQLFDPSEPLFDRSTWHPLVLYHQVRVAIGRPIRITSAQKQDYHGRKALNWVNELTASCQQEIRSLLNQAF